LADTGILSLRAVDAAAFCFFPARCFFYLHPMLFSTIVLMRAFAGRNFSTPGVPGQSFFFSNYSVLFSWASLFSWRPNVNGSTVWMIRDLPFFFFINFAPLQELFLGFFFDNPSFIPHRILWVLVGFIF